MSGLAYLFDIDDTLMDSTTRSRSATASGTSSTRLGVALRYGEDESSHRPAPTASTWTMWIPSYLSRFLFTAFPRVATCCVLSDIRVVSSVAVGCIIYPSTLHMTVRQLP